MGLIAFYDGVGRRQTATLSGTATSLLDDGWGVAEEQQASKASADLPSALKSMSARMGWLDLPHRSARLDGGARRWLNADDSDLLWL